MGGNENRPDKENKRPDEDAIEADRQNEVGVWARGFGVSSADLRGALNNGRSGPRNEAEAERARQDEEGKRP